MFVQQFLMAAMGASILFASPTLKSQDIDDDIAEELQEQIDYLRAAIKELQEQLKQEGITNEELQKIQNQFDQLQYQLQECYKKIDQLKQELQQEFRQKLNELQSEMLQMYNQLSERIRALEDKVQKLILDQTVGLIQDGSPNTAAKTFQNAEYQKLHLPRVIKDAFGSNTKNCFTILEFCDLLKLDTMTAYGFLYTFEHLSPHVFTSQGSDCAFKLGRSQQRLKALTYNSTAKESLEVLEAKFPKALRLIVSGASIKIRKNPYPCSFSSDNDALLYYRTYVYRGSDMNIWKAQSTGDSEETYKFIEQGSGLQLAYYCVLSACLPTLESTNSGRQMWKPILVSNEQVHFRNSDSSQYYLRAAETSDFRNCFVLALSKDMIEPWYITKA